MQEATGRPTPIAGLLAVLGGALLAIGSFLDWAEVSGGGTSVTASGIDGTDGWITLVAGVLVLLAGVALLGVAGRKIIAIVAIVAGLVGGGVGLYDALTAKDRVLDDAAEELAPQVGNTPEEVRALLDQAIDAGEIGISISIGLYMVIIGGVLGIVGGVLGLRSPAAAPVAAEASMPGGVVPPEPAPAVGASAAADPGPVTDPPAQPPPPAEPPVSVEPPAAPPTTSEPPASTESGPDTEPPAPPPPAEGSAPS